MVELTRYKRVCICKGYEFRAYLVVSFSSFF